LIAANSEPRVDAGTSVALDLCRFAFALWVAAAHWSQNFFQEGWPDLPPAIAAVGGFFVLSGYTIRFVTQRSQFHLDEYLVRRLARLWSVVLPALVLTAALDFTSAAINPGFYWSHWHPAHPWLGLAASALFLTQMWGLDIVPMANSPFWSIGYEAWFYLVYGLMLCRKPLVSAVAALLAGPNIWFLFPLWLSGVAVYDLTARADTNRKLTLLALSSAVLAASVSGFFAIRGEQFRATYEAVLSGYFGFFHVGRARVVGSTLPAAALIFALLLPGLLAVIRVISPPVPGRVVKIARWLGEFTFPLYLLHFPLFVLCASLHLYNRHSSPQKILMFVAVCAVIACFVPLTERFKRALQAGLTRHIRTAIAIGKPQPSRVAGPTD